MILKCVIVVNELWVLYPVRYCDYFCCCYFISAASYSAATIARISIGYADCASIALLSLMCMHSNESVVCL